jgi:hydrogenase nickel incorporation protein HypB
MCRECGCSLKVEPVRVHDHAGVALARAADPRSVDVLGAMLAQNGLVAAHNRAHFAANGVLAINLMSSPGAGKTSLLESTIEALGGRLGIGVIEGDLETENDAERIRARGVPAVQITTGQACHLDAAMVHDALDALNLSEIDVLFIENVGNLVCPAAFDLGQYANVTLLSVTEGDDKPAKYPVMFRAADLVVLSKVDLLGVIDDFVPEDAEGHLRALANAATMMQVSARRRESLGPWLAWIEEQLARFRQDVARPARLHHHASE